MVLRHGFLCSMTICVFAWMMPMAYNLAPSFLQPRFLAIALLSLFGFLASFVYFKEAITWYNYLGMLFAIGGSILLIK